ncbi:hypothetical protein D3C76_882650 [compost metagenome]
MIGDIPDFQHCLIFDGVPRVGGKPLGKRLSLGVRAIAFVQTHAPMRCRICDCIFGFWVIWFAHRLFPG